MSFSKIYKIIGVGCLASLGYIIWRQYREPSINLQEFTDILRSLTCELNIAFETLAYFV